MPNGSGDSGPGKRPTGTGTPSNPPRAGNGEFQARMKIGTGEVTGPVRTAPTDAAGRAKLAAGDASTWAKDEAAQLLTNYKKSSKYFKWKFWIVAAYALVSTVSLAYAAWPDNTISAYAKILPDPGDSKKVLIFIRNDSSSDWKHVQVIINEAWVAEKDKLSPLGDVTFSLGQFRKAGTVGPEGKPPANISVRTLTVKCDRGSYTMPVK